MKALSSLKIHGDENRPVKNAEIVLQIKDVPVPRVSSKESPLQVEEGHSLLPFDQRGGCNDFSGNRHECIFAGISNRPCAAINVIDAGRRQRDCIPFSLKRREASLVQNRRAVNGVHIPVVEPVAAPAHNAPVSFPGQDGGGNEFRTAPGNIVLEFFAPDT